MPEAVAVPFRLLCPLLSLFLSAVARCQPSPVWPGDDWVLCSERSQMPLWLLLSRHELRHFDPFLALVVACVALFVLAPVRHSGDRDALALSF